MSPDVESRAIVGWPAIARGALVGLGLIIPITILDAILDRRIDDFEDSGWRVLIALLIMAAFIPAGTYAARFTPNAPLTNGALAGLGAFALWIPFPRVDLAHTGRQPRARERQRPGPPARSDLRLPCHLDRARNGRRLLGLPAATSRRHRASSVPVAGAGRSSPGTTTTGHGACCTTCWLTDPSSSPLNPPTPREPTTTSSAPRAASSRARAGRSFTTRRSTATSIASLPTWSRAWSRRRRARPSHRRRRRTRRPAGRGTSKRGSACTPRGAKTSLLEGPLERPGASRQSHRFRPRWSRRSWPLPRRPWSLPASRSPPSRGRDARLAARRRRRRPAPPR